MWLALLAVCFVSSSINASTLYIFTNGCLVHYFKIKYTWLQIFRSCLSNERIIQLNVAFMTEDNSKLSFADILLHKRGEKSENNDVI